LLSDALLRGEVNDAILRDIASLDARDVSPSLEKTMLMALTDTRDGRLRNLLALALAKAQSPEAVPKLVSLLSDPKTFGYRSTLLYTLHKFNFTPSVRDLVFLILFDTPEVQGEASLLLEEAIPLSKPEDRVAAVQWALDSLRTRADARTTEAAIAALELLLASLRN
jgi:HEAT repeat protein